MPQINFIIFCCAKAQNPIIIQIIRSNFQQCGDVQVIFQVFSKIQNGCQGSTNFFFVGTKSQKPIFWRGILKNCRPLVIACYQAIIQTNISYSPIIRFTVASVIILCLDILSSP